MTPCKCWEELPAEAAPAAAPWPCIPALQSPIQELWRECCCGGLLHSQASDFLFQCKLWAGSLTGEGVTLSKGQKKPTFLQGHWRAGSLCGGSWGL